MARDDFHVNPHTPFAGVEPADFHRWYPREIPPVDNTFEIGLVMAGAVSAGAYTAGVLDYLFESLDRWYRERREDASLPRHEVKLRVMTGSSAGGINAALAAAALRYRFPHIHDDGSLQGSANPFFDPWVNRIDIRDLLDTADIDSGAPLTALLNCRQLDAIAERSMGFVGDPLQPGERDWLADPFQVQLTYSNLQGVPYWIRFQGESGLPHEVVLHQDYLSFGVPVRHDADPGQFPPDVIRLPRQRGSEDRAWASLGRAALATSAFPIALQPREIWRSTTDYEYRFAYLGENDRRIYARPWPAGASQPARAVVVDGGALNNEPFDLAHRVLAGRQGKNPRRGVEAHRALLMIDPLSDARAADPTLSDALSQVPVQLLKAFMNQSRFKQIDLTLAEADDVYSRFLVAPSRHPFVGRKALASGELGAFLGFFHRRFRQHDFLLGRYNCHFFLKNWFVLPGDNPLFRERPPAERFQSRRRPDHYQIVPVLADDPPLPAWPTDALDGYDDLAGPLERRLDALYPALREQFFDRLKLGGFQRWAGRSYLWPLWRVVLRPQLRDALEKALDGAAREIRNRRFGG